MWNNHLSCVSNRHILLGEKEYFLAPVVSSNRDDFKRNSLSNCIDF